MSGTPAESTLLSHLNRLLIHATDLRGVVGAALDLALALGAHNVAVYMFDRDRQELVLAGERNHPPDLVSEWQRLPLSEETLLTQAVRSGLMQNMPDLLTTTQLSKSADSARRTGFRSALSLPLIVEGVPVGALGCGFLQPLSADDPRADALRAVAQGIAIAVLHARMADEARQREADQAMLADATRLFNSTLDVGRTLRDVARSAALALGDACMILLCEPQQTALTVAAHFHRDSAVAEARLQRARLEPLRVDQEPLAEIVRTRRPVLMNSIGGRIELPAAYHESPPTSWIGAPIVFHDEVLGVLAISSTTEGTCFRQRELRLALSLADSAAPAIANARLFRQISGEHVFVQSVLNNLPEAIIIVEGNDLRLTVINRAGRELLDGGPPEGTPLAAWTPYCTFAEPNGSPFVGEAHPLARAGRGEAILSQEMVIHLGNGRDVDILGNFAPVRDAEGQVIAAAAVMQDITHRRELDQQKDDFLAIAAHELRTPLTMIRGQLQLIDRRGVQIPDDLRGRLAIVRDQAERMTELASRLLDVSRIGSGRLDLHLALTDLGTLAREVAARYELRAVSHKIEVRVPPEPVVGRWDRSRLEEVLANLLDNAIRYSPDGGQIEVVVEGNHQVASLEVADHGIGIAPEDQARLFERYTRATRTARDVKEGLGLGLFICRTIVEAHGGAIALRSAPDAGTTFTISLPIQGVSSAERR